VLADAGRVILGRWGFVVIGLAAVLATASGVNATMFGDANLAYMVSKAGELPKDFARGVWRGGTGGRWRRSCWMLIISSGSTTRTGIRSAMR